jgi:hypothetical protein
VPSGTKQQPERAGDEKMSRLLKNLNSLKSKLLSKTRNKSSYSYEDRIVAFIDILGFKDKIDKTISGDNIDKIIQAYDIIRNTCRLNAKNKDEEKINKALDKSRKTTVFSDSIVISFLHNQTSEIFNTISDLQLMLVQLVQYDFVCRGALISGKMIHTKDFCFGPAFIEAYKTECKAALYPRIILSEDLIKIAGKYGRHDADSEMEWVKSLLKQDTDGMYYIDYFESVRDELDDYEFSSYIRNISTFIRNEIQSANNPDVKIKYMWMRDKVNKVIEKIDKEKWVANFTNQGDTELANIYASLKRIEY